MAKPVVDLQNIILSSVKSTFDAAGIKSKNLPEVSAKGVSPQKTSSSIKETVIKTATLLKEAIVLVPKTFLMKTEFLSSKAKQAHESLYKEYVDAFNKCSSLLDAANPEEAGSAHSPYRSLKIDEQYNLNAVKLHELYFTNISDASSHIAVDSIPFMRLARDFGTFDRWQFCFRACAMSAREGWVVTYYEPYRNCYMTCVVDSHNVGIPLGGIPVVVLDMWAHSYYRDYLDDKKSYVNAMMRELNWNVIEARMMIAERANVDAVFKIQPITNSVPDRILQAVNADNMAPIQKDQIQSSEVTGNQPAPQIGDQGKPRGA
jgi:Fe-Mn family superoxide dismutase